MTLAPCARIFTSIYFLANLFHNPAEPDAKIRPQGRGFLLMKIHHAHRLSNASHMIHNNNYSEAKSGNLQAAFDLVDSFQFDFSVFQKYTGYICPVQKISGNKIPFALASRIALKSPLILADGIYLLNHRPGNEMIKRMFYLPDYSGQVLPGKYILVDDVFTTGITLMGLKSHIENNGSHVSSIYTLGSSRHGLYFDASKLNIRILKAKFPEIETYFDVNYLTISQMNYLMRFTSLSSFHDLRYQNQLKTLFYI